MYDTNHDGFLGVSEIKEMVRDISNIQNGKSPTEEEVEKNTTNALE